MTSKTSPTIDRRTVCVGAGVAGAAAVIAAAVTRNAPAPQPQQAVQARVDETGGYQLTDHVKQYYATARI